jgi:hypothetical protein
VNVTRGGYILSDNDNFQGITDATVTILEGGQYLTTLTPTPTPRGFDEINWKGWYTSLPVVSKAGKTYEIKVSAPGFNTISAISHIPVPVEISRVDVVSTTRDENSMIPVDIYFYDPGETENFYEIFVRRDEKLINPDGEYNGAYQMALLTQDPAYYYKVESYKDFLKPPKPLPVLFNDVGLNGKLIKISALFYAPINVPFPDEGYTFEITYSIVLRTLSKGYYLYKTSKQLQQNTNNDPFAQPVPIYSNVQNGFGIFAGVTTSKFEIDF